MTRRTTAAIVPAVAYDGPSLGLNSVGADIPTCVETARWANSEMENISINWIFARTIHNPNIFNGKRGCELETDDNRIIYACANTERQATASMLAGSIAEIDACYNRL